MTLASLPIDPLTGLPARKKKTSAWPGGPDLTGDTLDPSVQARIGSTGAPTSPGDITLPGFTPDYGSLIQNDPVFAQLRKDLAAQGAGDLAGRNASLNRLFTGFGALPDINAAGHQLGFDVGQAIDPTTAQLAADNPYSTQANLSHAHSQAISQLRRQLAARGGLQSGELGFQLGNENRAYGNAQTQATAALLDSIAQLQGGFTASQKAAQQQASQGASEAADRQTRLNPPTGSQKALLDDEASNKWGKPIYKDPNGNLWNPDGSPFVPPAQTSQPEPPDTGAQTTGVDPNGYGGLDIGAFLAPGVASGHRLDPRYLSI